MFINTFALALTAPVHVPLLCGPGSGVPGGGSGCPRPNGWPGEPGPCGIEDIEGVRICFSGFGRGNVEDPGSGDDGPGEGKCGCVGLSCARREFDEER